MRRMNLALTVILAEALACFLIWSNFAPDHHITAAHSLVWALIASMVLAFSADRIGLNLIEYVVDGVLARQRSRTFYWPWRAAQAFTIYFRWRLSCAESLELEACRGLPW